MPEVPGKRFELVNGELVEMPGRGWAHGTQMGHVYSLLRDHVRAHNLGVVVPAGTSYILRREPALVRVPDVSFVARERIPAGGITVGFAPFAPDLAVEVVSPGDRPREVLAKVGDHLAAGSRAVWVLWPERRAATVHWPDGTSIELGPDDELDGGEVLPGFRVAVGELFESEWW